MEDDCRLPGLGQTMNLSRAVLSVSCKRNSSSIAQVKPATQKSQKVISGIVLQNLIYTQQNREHNELSMSGHMLSVFLNPGSRNGLYW